MAPINNIDVISHFSYTSLDHLEQCKSLSTFYQEVLYAYDKSQVLNKPENKLDMLRQPLWGNRFIGTSKKQKYVCLYFTSFINRNINRVADLAFNDGLVDEKFIHDNIKDKRNFFGEITMLKKALKPFIDLIGKNIPDQCTHVNASLNSMMLKRKPYYKQLTQKKVENPASINKLKNWLNCTELNLKPAYIAKIKDIRDFKLAEFNYKVLNCTLACNRNLTIWGKSDTDKCDICNEIQDIPHLLYYCNFSKYIWNLLEGPLHSKITIQDLIVGGTNTQNNFAISLVFFIIYKHWLINKSENTKRIPQQVKPFFRSALGFRITVYSKTKVIDAKILTLLQEIKDVFLE